jgi:hypothetical protein
LINLVRYIGNAVYAERTPVVIPAVVELAPVVVGRGGYPSSKHQDSKGVGNDGVR